MSSKEKTYQVGAKCLETADSVGRPVFMGQKVIGVLHTSKHSTRLWFTYGYPDQYLGAVRRCPSAAALNVIKAEMSRLEKERMMQNRSEEKTYPIDDEFPDVKKAKAIAVEHLRESLKKARSVGEKLMDESIRNSGTQDLIAERVKELCPKSMWHRVRLYPENKLVHIEIGGDPACVLDRHGSVVPNKNRINEVEKAIREFCFVPEGFSVHFLWVAATEPFNCPRCGCTSNHVDGAPEGAQCPRCWYPKWRPVASCRHAAGFSLGLLHDGRQRTLRCLEPGCEAEFVPVQADLTHRELEKFVRGEFTQIVRAPDAVTSYLTGGGKVHAMEDKYKTVDEDYCSEQFVTSSHKRHEHEGGILVAVFFDRERKIVDDAVINPFKLMWISEVKR